MYRLLLLTLGILLLLACSGIETQPDDTASFAARDFTRYAWRNAPLPGTENYRDQRMQTLDDALRSAVDARLAELGYRRVPTDEAQFLVEYFAAPGMVDGRLARNASNVTPLPSGTINRQINQAEVDNAYALGGPRTTGNIALVFVSRADQAPLWKVLISSLVENVNTVDRKQVTRAVRRGLATLPAAAGESR